MQDTDRPADVQTVSLPPGDRRASVDVQPVLLRSQCFTRRGRRRDRRRHVRQQLPVRPPEAERTIGLSLDLITLFVHRAVMPATEHGEIRQLRRASMRPVANVMTLTEGPITTR